jgi:hypothetical protein
MRILSKNIEHKSSPIVILIIILMISAASCTGRKAKLDRRNMIPEKELVKLLTDLYIADGLITHPHVNKWFPALDSTSTYYHIIAEHGYTKATLDKTLKFYFYRNPKKLISIYDKVLGILSEMESRTQKAVLSEQTRADNLWPGNDHYPFPDVVGENPASFDILINRIGNYTLTFTATVFPDDESENPGMIAYTYITDGSGNEVRTYLKPVKYIKDGNPHTYTTSVNVSQVTNSHFAGNLFSVENNPESGVKHSVIESVRIGYVYTAL